MNFNIVVILILLLLPFYALIKKLVVFFINRNKREIVRQHIADESNKRSQYSPSHNLKMMSDLMTPKYFANIFYKQYLDVVRYNIGEQISIIKYENMESSPMESNYYFNLSKNRMANNLFMRNAIPKKFWNNFIFPEIAKFMHPDTKQGYPLNVINIEIIFVGDQIKLPPQYYKNDIYICCLKGIAEIKYVFPSITNDLDPLECFRFVRKDIDDIECDAGSNELREGDYLYLPNGTPFNLQFKTNYPTQTVFIIEFDNFLKNGKQDREIDFIKLEQLQMRKISRKVYPKNLEKDELEILWKKNLINGTIWEKNQVINNIL